MNEDTVIPLLLIYSTGKDKCVPLCVQRHENRRSCLGKQKTVEDSMEATNYVTVLLVSFTSFSLQTWW